MLPLTVIRMYGTVNFKVASKDVCQILGVFPNLPAGFNPAGQTLQCNVEGAQASFNLLASGRGFALGADNKRMGIVGLRLNMQKNKATGTRVFVGGPATFMAVYRGNWKQDWQHLGVDATANKKNVLTPVNVQVMLSGVNYSAQVPALLTVKAQQLAKMIYVQAKQKR